MRAYGTLVSPEELTRSRRLLDTLSRKSFLLQAITHPSYGDNRLTVSYEKLEFLEDAVLDYLVTCYIYTNTELEAAFAEFC